MGIQVGLAVTVALEGQQEDLSRTQEGSRHTGSL